MDTVMMPRELTAENGAKKLMSGEFTATTVIQCRECGGDGYQYHERADDIDCDNCNGTGEETIVIPIEWSTIKEIYAMVVRHRLKFLSLGK